jgi:hypothetical protein
MREVVWPSLLIFAAACWMCVWVVEVDPDPLPKWVQIAGNTALLIMIAQHIWRGRESA